MNLSTQPFVWTIGNFCKLRRIQFHAQFLFSRFAFSLLSRVYSSFKSLENSNSINDPAPQLTYDNVDQIIQQRCLKNIGIDTEKQLLPVSLGNKLIDMELVNGAKEYPASRPATGWSAPWAK